jgi:hypothetical protein
VFGIYNLIVSIAILTYALNANSASVTVQVRVTFIDPAEIGLDEGVIQMPSSGFCYEEGDGILCT